jgi:hypothetical protein
MIRDREELERRAGLELGIPRRYWDVHRFFFGPTLDGRPTRFCAATGWTT